MDTPSWSTTIKRARERIAMDIPEFARRSDVRPDRLVAIEHGEAVPTIGELFGIARALRVDFEALLRGWESPEPEAALAFRSRDAAWGSLSDADLVACERALTQARMLLEVNARLGRTRSARSGFKPEEPRPDIEKDVRDLSVLVRNNLGDADGKLPDLVAVCDALDVLIVEHHFASADVDAVAVTERGTGNGAAIVVAQGSHAWRSHLRRRVLLAHELCHVLADPPEGTADATVDFASDPSEDQDAEPNRLRYLPQQVSRERRARAFAAEFLMPTAGLHRLLGPPRHVHDYGDAQLMVDQVREHFETPLEIALNQLWNRGFLAPIPDLRTEDPRADLLAYLRSSRVRQGLSVEPVAPLRSSLARRVQQAWGSDLCSDAEARRWLDLSPFDPLPWSRAE